MPRRNRDKNKVFYLSYVLNGMGMAVLIYLILIDEAYLLRLHLIEPPDKIAVAANMPSNEILVVSVVYKQSTTTRHI